LCGLVGLGVVPRKSAKRRGVPVPTPRTQPAPCAGQGWARVFQVDSEYQVKTCMICNGVD
ncbi:hypothetical protein, partial [Actinobaculum suis]|uniref:hypothetical protein n=1 Tax=Actinobaculum suis TaxID=1657 RepID=UPI001C3FF7A3